MALLSPLIGRFLQRFPLLHTAVKAAYTARLAAQVPAVTPFGFKFVGPVAMQRGEFEAEEVARFLAVIGGYDVLINVGANTGYYVCLARARGLRVVAIEPDERNLKLLMRNCETNAWLDVEVLPVAVGSRAGLLPLYGGGTAASLVRGWAGAAKARQLVPVDTLDNLLGQRLGGQRVLVLMDVEGFELQALEGARRLLEMSPAPDWMVKICINEHQPEGHTVNPYLQETFGIFRKLGYEARFVTDPDSIVSASDVALWSEGESIPDTHNFFFSKPGPSRE